MTEVFVPSGVRAAVDVFGAGLKDPPLTEVAARVSTEAGPLFLDDRVHGRWARRLRHA